MRISPSIVVIGIMSILLFSNINVMSARPINTHSTVITQHTQGLVKSAHRNTRTNTQTQPRNDVGYINIITSWGDDIANRATLDMKNINSIATGGAHHLAINQNGTVIGWGNNTKGQLNIPETIKNGQDDVVDISAGDFHSTAIVNNYDNDGIKHTVVKVWGDNSKGQHSIPAKIVNDQATPLAIAAGAYHTIAYSTEYDTITGSEIVTIESWGNNSTNSVPDALSPIDPIHEGVQQLLARGNHNAVLLGDGSIYEWYTTGQSTAHLADTDTRYTKIALGENHLLAITNNNTLVGWSNNSSSKGEIAIAFPTEVDCWRDVVSGSNHVVAIDCNDNIYAWGDNSKRQTTIPRLVAENITGRLQLVAYGDHTVLLYQVRPTYELVRWGSNANDLPSIRTDLQYISAGVNHSMAIISDSTVIAWGDNSHGQSTVPITLTNAYSLANGTNHSLALDDAGTIWGWGSNKSGQLNIPENLGQIIDIAAGRDFSIAYSITPTNETDSNGSSILTNTVTIWGGNAKKTVPTNELKNIVSLKCYDNHCAAMVARSIMVNGDPTIQHYLVDWVYTNDNTGAKIVTTRKPLNSNYQYIDYAVGGSHTLVIQTYEYTNPITGEINVNTKVIGFLNSGASNVGQIMEQYIPTNTDVRMIAAGATHSMLLTTDNRLVMWGSNSVNERVIPNALNTIISISAGTNYNLAVAFIDESLLPTATATRTATRTATNSRTATNTRTATSTKSATSTRSNTLTRTNSRTPTNSATRTITRTRTATRTITNTRTATATMTASRTTTPSQTRSATKTATPSQTPRP